MSLTDRVDMASAGENVDELPECVDGLGFESRLACLIELIHELLDLGVRQIFVFAKSRATLDHLRGAITKTSVDSCHFLRSRARRNRQPRTSGLLACRNDVCDIRRVEHRVIRL